ncbi:Ribosomal large subunit pseudouridine synthase D [Nitrincola lacisaponensis]|uniref:Ribosomal large subunit pseudouridine synthase D n=1 Tax=Nitrincola lacisaponensis TaxID=267850 RepID=A0A063Y190_9GAMM|nr:RluA family pseudouridine synthase [Nitrincola lacisaponensis]KDE38920.1 Ribosomal large subunit pseudouridine synthase D [Nitrincola lacisaponensis]
MALELRHTVTAEEAGTDAASLLCQLSQLPKQRIKDAMAKGAVQLQRRQRKRLRRATETLQTGDQLSLSYDTDILARKPPEGTRCIARQKHYSVWFKPAGLMSQGTAFGDHLSLLRLAEQQLNRPVFLVHRLDRETAGLMLIAHTSVAAATLSRLFEQHQIEKIYQARVRGETPAEGRIDLPLDGKTAITHYQRLSYDASLNQSCLRIRLETGRTHQIRRHLDAIEHPIIGDPRYGRGNKNNEGLQLLATELHFQCPERKQQIKYCLDGYNK